MNMYKRIGNEKWENANKIGKVEDDMLKKED